MAVATPQVADALRRVGSGGAHKGALTATTRYHKIRLQKLQSVWGAIGGVCNCGKSDGSEGQLKLLEDQPKEHA